MQTPNAVAALSALAHETRLGVFRLLVTAGPDGLAAGAVAAHLGVVPATLSFHLGHLERAGLLRSWRAQRHVFYAADYDGMRRLVGFLLEDCCAGHCDVPGARPAAPSPIQPTAEHQP